MESPLLRFIRASRATRTCNVPVDEYGSLPLQRCAVPCAHSQDDAVRHAWGDGKRVPRELRGDTEEEALRPSDNSRN